MDTYKIGNFLQTLRKAKGLTQQDLADTFEVSNKTVSKWECGQALPELPLLKALAEFYDITVDELLNGERSSKFVENNKERKKNQKYFFSKTLKNFNVFAASSYLIALFSFILLIVLTYAINKNDIPTFVCYCILFISIVVYILGNILFGHLDEDFEEEFLLKFKKHKYELHVGFIGSVLYIFIMSTLCFVLPREATSSNGWVLSITSFLQIAFINLFVIGLIVFISFLYIRDKKFLIKLISKNSLFYLFSGLTLISMFLMPYKYGKPFGPNDNTIYTLIIGAYDGNVVPFLFFVILPVLLVAGDIVFAIIKRKNINLHWINYLICLIAVFLFACSEYTVSIGTDSLLTWANIIRVVVFFIAFILSLSFFIRRINLKKKEQCDGEVIEENNSEIEKTIHNKKKSVDKNRE